MNLANFYRNYLSKWYRSATDKRGHEMSYEDAREIVYRIPCSEWKDKHKKEPTDEQKATYAERKATQGKH